MQTKHFEQYLTRRKHSIHVIFIMILPCNIKKVLHDSRDVYFSMQSQLIIVTISPRNNDLSQTRPKVYEHFLL